MQEKPVIQPGSYYVYIVILLMVGSLLAWQAWSRSANFDHFHKQLANATVSGAAAEIELLVRELQRSMRVFAAEHTQLMEDILHSPDNDDLWLRLETAVSRHFPESFGMTITDSAGTPLRPDFENRVGEVCEHDINDYIEHGFALQGVIHPNPTGYHFDIMIPWGNSEIPQGVFFLSFQPAMLARILQNLQLPGHKLLLLNTEREGLIEVTAQGARDILTRDFSLSEEEHAQTLASVQIAYSHWRLVDLPEPQLLYQEAIRNWVYAAAVFSGFAAIILLMLYLLQRKERSRQQAEQRAQHHQEQLAHVDRLNTLGEMASGIAHELNQPLSAISTYCQSGLRIIEKFDPRPEKLAHILESSSRQAKRAGEIIHPMREFASKGKSQPELVDINRVIMEAIDFTRPELMKKGIALQLDLVQARPQVMADSIQIEQVIMNLMRNAIEAMTAGGTGPRRLTISSRLAEDGKIRVRVCDTGHGLQPETENRIFEAFYSTKPGGTGLGLAISRSIIEAHGGQLYVDKTMGAETCLCFVLPTDR